MWMLGLAITLPLILISGPLAGYCIAYVLIENFEAPSSLIPILMGLGLAGSGLQSYRIIQRLYRNIDPGK